MKTTNEQAHNKDYKGPNTILKKVIYGILGTSMCYFGGIGSCHYAMSHYYYGNKKYNTCLYHAQRAHRHFSPYRESYYTHLLNVMIKTASNNYGKCEDYYTYYKKEKPFIPLRVMNLTDEKIKRRIDLAYIPHADTSSKALFLRMQSIINNKAIYHIEELNQYKAALLYIDPIHDIEYPHVLRRFMHMHTVNCHTTDLLFALSNKYEDNKAKEIAQLEKIVTEITNEFVPIAKEDDHLLHLEYGLVCTNILWKLSTYKIHDKTAKSYIPEASQKLYNTVRIIREDTLAQRVKEYTDLVEGIRFMKEIMTIYEKN